MENIETEVVKESKDEVPFEHTLTLDDKHFSDDEECEETPIEADDRVESFDLTTKTIKIRPELGFKPMVHHQRSPNPLIKEVQKGESINWLQTSGTSLGMSDHKENFNNVSPLKQSVDLGKYKDDCDISALEGSGYDRGQMENINYPMKATLHVADTIRNNQLRINYRKEPRGLEHLSGHLKYAFYGDDYTMPITIPEIHPINEKDKMLKVLHEFKKGLIKDLPLGAVP